MSDGSPRMPHFDEAAQGRAALLRLLRILLVALVVPVVVFYVVDIGEDPQDLGEWEVGLITGWPYVLLFAFALAFGVLAIDILTPQKKISTLSGVFLGLLVGVMLTIAISFLIDRLVEVYGLSDLPSTSDGSDAQGGDGNDAQGGVDRLVTTVKILFGIALTYLCVSIVLQTQDQFRLVIPYVEFSKQIRGMKPLLLDSSALIDGRILDLAETGALQAPMIVPRFVLDELQRLSDSNDKMKRSRGRRGLDFVTKLQRSAVADVSVDETQMPPGGVDQLLVDLAGQMSATIVTNDAGLNRVATIHSVSVLNLNDVANALKPNVIPGEGLRVRLIKRGEQANQAVGYLDDGTMVVAEDGAGRIGEEVTLAVTSSLQTSAGRLIFGRLDGASAAGDGTTSESSRDDAPSAPSARSQTERADSGRAGEDASEAAAPGATVSTHESGDCGPDDDPAPRPTSHSPGPPESAGPTGPPASERSRPSSRNPRRS